jgi:NAD(P)-dependent dehydrogenase (short-subunit alcohol dehydrogenase family)
VGWLDGQTALVTGGGSGLGRAILERFLEEGADVGVLEIDPDKAADLSATYGDHVRVTIGDATDWVANEHAVADTVAAFGSLDTFIGDAGLWDYGASIDALVGEQIGERAERPRSPDMRH